MLNVSFKGKKSSHSHLVRANDSNHDLSSKLLLLYFCKDVRDFVKSIISPDELHLCSRPHLHLTREVNRWKPIFQWLQYIPAHQSTCVHYVPHLPASVLRSCQPHCPGYRCLVELSVSLSPVFLSPHSISFAGNRC